MVEGPRSDWATWAEKAALRLAECETEIRRLPSDARPARRSKLEARREAYVRLLARLRSRAAEKEGASAGPQALEAEVDRLKERILGAAASLVRDRARLNALRGRVPSDNGPDFSFAPPEGTANDTEKAAFAILRSLGL